MIRRVVALIGDGETQAPTRHGGIDADHLARWR